MARKRRGHGEGSIYQRADGRWCATISVGYSESGKRRRRTVFGTTKPDVQEKLRLVATEISHSPDIEPQRIKVGEYLDRWLRDAAKPKVRESTHYNYNRVIKTHIKPQLGGVLLAKLTPIQIHAMYATLQREGKSPETIRLTHAVLHRALKQAVRWRLVPYNVSSDVERPKVVKSDITPLNSEQAAAFLEAARGDRLEAVFVLAVTTGMRLGELFALQWPDVDFGTKSLTVRHSLQELNGKLSLTEPKTAKGRRRIDLPDMAVEALLRHQKKMAAEGFEDVTWVFCNNSGGALRRSHFHYSDFKPILIVAKLPDIRFHDLRHTSATLLLSLGIIPKVVQERLGHSQISVTLDTYSHVLPTMQREAAGKLNQLLRPKAK